MISITNKSNYLARVVTLPAPRKHSNADRLQCVSILGNNVITGLIAKENELYCYFPLETAINKDFLAFTNSFSNPEDNVDGKTKGFFGLNCRVRAIRLRGERSEGYIVPAKEISKWSGYEITEKDVDTDFDTINGKLICEKYINRQELIDADKAERKEKRKNKKVVRTSKLVENQFRLHSDTEQLKRNIHKLSPNDVISVSNKRHGCNGVLSKILCKKSLSLWDKIGKKLGFNIIDTHYDYIWASRRCIKNEYADAKSSHFYDSDIWAGVYERYKDSLKNGITLYYELCGWTPTGAPIQKGYDYGLEVGKNEAYVFAITYTSPDGSVFDFNAKQVTDYCRKMGLKRIELFYHGLAKDMFPEIKTDDYWHENFLKALSDKYLEKDDPICKNQVPFEGIIICQEGDQNVNFKLKSFRFLERTTEENDKGTIDIDDIN